jgi:cyclase
MSVKYSKGLAEVGTGLYAYLQPNGSWGWSNAGLITSAGKSMLVDTLYTLDLTREMIEAMRRAIPATRSFDTLVNSHADGDHTWGNQLIEGAQIVATANALEEMEDFSPEEAMRLRSGDAELGLAGRFSQYIFAPFDFSDVEVTLPTTTFTGTMTMQVGEKEVRLYEVGPAHTRGDLIVHVPADRVAYVADVLFVGGHPAIWSGPIRNLIKACDRILDLDVDVIVPGHGPVTDNDGARRVRDYLEYVSAEGKRFHGEGLTPWEAALAIDLSAYEDWIAEERIVLVMNTIYAELDPDARSADMSELMADMGRYLDRLGRLG